MLKKVLRLRERRGFCWLVTTFRLPLLAPPPLIQLGPNLLYYKYDQMVVSPVKVRIQVKVANYGVLMGIQEGIQSLQKQEEEL